MSILNLYKQSSTPGTPSANTANVHLDNTAIPRARLVDENGNVYTLLDSKHNDWHLSNSSVSSVSGGYASDTYLAGSAIAIPAAGLWKARSQYKLSFDMVKTAAGTAAAAITIRMGTLGTTGDASILALTFGAGTAVADTGFFDVMIGFRTVGSGTSAVIQAVACCSHALAATGLVSTGASGAGIVIGTSSGFDSTTQTIIGASFNGGASFSGTCTLVQAELKGLTT
jgi:hypothetical protein